MNMRVRTNAGQVAQAWNNRTQGMKGVIRTAIQDAIKFLRGKLRYPPPAPVPGYQRTYRLQRALQSGAQDYINIEYLGSGGFAIYGEWTMTDPPYAGYVIDEATQAYMHRGYWWTVQSKAQQHMDRMRQILSDALDRYWGGLDW